MLSKMDHPCPRQTHSLDHELKHPWCLEASSMSLCPDSLSTPILKPRTSGTITKKVLLREELAFNQVVHLVGPDVL